MKKAISLLIILALTLSLSVVSFAATDIPDNYGAYGINNFGRATTFAADENAGTITFANPDATYLSAPAIYNGTDLQSYNPNDLILVNDGKIVGNDSLLIPDNTYEFQIYYATGAVTAPGGTAVNTLPAANNRLTKLEVGTGSVRIRTVTGSSSIQSAKIKTSGRGNAMTYTLELTTRAQYSTSIKDVEYTLGVTNSTAPINTTSHLFRVGFNTIAPGDTNVGEEGTITISNDAPVVLKDQFTEIAKSANYKNVIFEGEDGNWSFKGKVAGMKDTNFTYNYDPDTNLLNTYPEHEFKFLNFPAGVNFPTIGEMRIDVSDISDTYGTMYAYLYRDGRLTEINGTYDAVDDQLVFRTNYLGKFIITDRPITEAGIPEEPEEEIVPMVPENNTNNPHTGAAAPDAMVAIGLLSLASAAVISRKRK